jgi:hypothetical protein
LTILIKQKDILHGVSVAVVAVTVIPVAVVVVTVIPVAVAVVIAVVVVDCEIGVSQKLPVHRLSHIQIAISSLFCVTN